MTRLIWTLAFLLFDREDGRVRPGPVTGIAAAALAVASHLWLSGPWLRDAAFPALPATAASSPLTHDLPSAAEGPQRCGSTTEAGR